MVQNGGRGALSETRPRNLQRNLRRRTHLTFLTFGGVTGSFHYNLESNIVLTTKTIGEPGNGENHELGVTI